MKQTQKGASFSERTRLMPERARDVIALGLGLLALAGANNAQTAEKSAHTISVGVVEDGVRQVDDAMARARVSEVVQAGFNRLKITIPYSPGQAEVLNDQNRVCEPARIASEEGLDFTLNVIPANIPGKVNNLPDRPSELQKFGTAMGAWVHTLKDCAPEMTDYTIELFNEPNSKTFARPQEDINGNPVAAKLVTRATYRGYQVIKDKAKEVGVDVTVLGGGLASNKDPISFIQQMGQAKKELGLKGPMMDGFAYHPYPLDSTEAPGTPHPEGKVLGMAELEQVISAADTAGLGPKNMPIVLSEVGYETTIPPDKKNLYLEHNGKQDPTIGEARQAKFFRELLRLASCSPRVVELDWFHLRDDPEIQQWQSGGLYADGSAKSSYPQIRQAIADARAGNFDCSSGLLNK